MTNTKLDILCSNCGNHQTFAYDGMFPSSVPAAGWGSFGRALYCPDCTKTWNARNPGRPMPGKTNTMTAAMYYTASQRKQTKQRKD